MPRLAANLSLLFTEHDFLDRFAAAADAGFEAVEVLFPYEHDAREIRARLERHGLQQALFNVRPGDWTKGERGLAILPERRAELSACLEEALAYAETIGCPRLHLAGVVPAGMPHKTAEAAFVANLADAAARAGARGIEILIEPLNARDAPGYFLTSVADARRIIEAVASPYLKLQLDLYHRQIMGGDLAETIRSVLPLVGHIQIAGVPGRHEPDIGEINYAYLLDLLDSLGYRGFVGCEYRPIAGTLAGLGWARPYGIGMPRRGRQGASS